MIFFVKPNTIALLLMNLMGNVVASILMSMIRIVMSNNVANDWRPMWRLWRRLSEVLLIS